MSIKDAVMGVVSQFTTSKGERQALPPKKKKNKSGLSEKELSRQLGRDLLGTITPRQGYMMHSDYFTIDKDVATIVSVFHQNGADDNLPPMWAIRLIPRDIGVEGVTARLLTHVNRAPDSWVAQKQTRADDTMRAEISEAEKSTRSRDNILASKKKRDFMTIAEDLASGDSYLHVSFRLLIKARTVEDLDEALDNLRRDYDTVFSSIYLAAHEGQQRDELKNAFMPAEKQLGSNYMFTSSEFAGSYNLVTHGIEDHDGEYAGVMKADVNNAAVIWNMNRYNSHVVIGTSNPAVTLTNQYERERSTSLWGVKLSQTALCNNHRVVHFVMNHSNLTKFGVDLSDITATVSMSNGDINPFEMFGKREDQLSIYPAHLEKLVLMTRQMNPSLNDIGASVLKEQLNTFYIEHRMWYRNAAEKLDELRIVGIPHEQIPRLRKFVAYLDSAYYSYLKQSSQDPNVVSALASLRGLYQSMLTANGDLFDTITSNAVDAASSSPRVIYDLSTLLRRGTGIAMAQFINALSYATNALEEGDVVMFHGAERIDAGIMSYVRRVVDDLKSNNIRVVFLYDDIEKMLLPENVSLCQLTTADWIVTGHMTEPLVQTFQERMGKSLPDSLAKAITSQRATQYFLSRSVDNIVMDIDFILE